MKIPFWETAWKLEKQINPQSAGRFAGIFKKLSAQGSFFFLRRMAGDGLLYIRSPFFHSNVIRYARRPFRDAEEMNKKLIENWNSRISAQDEVYILGDVTMKGPAQAQEILAQLRGRKYLIRGNHDAFADRKSFPEDLFVWIRDYAEIKRNGTHFVLFHYPIAEWNGFYRGAIHLHGHQHNTADYNDKNRRQGILCYDVGVDANGMAPVSLEEIFRFFYPSDNS